jgi:hypothetical protein
MRTAHPLREPHSEIAGEAQRPEWKTPCYLPAIPPIH